MKNFNKTTKAVIILLISAMMFFVSTKITYAESTNEIDPIDITEGTIAVEESQPIAKVAAAAGIGDIINAGKSFISNGSSGAQSADEFAEELAPIGSILVGIGIIVFFVVLLVIGMKWAVAKPEDKAKLKTALIGYVISAIVFFGAIGIWRMVRTIMENVESGL